MRALLVKTVWVGVLVGVTLVTIVTVAAGPARSIAWTLLLVMGLVLLLYFSGLIRVSGADQSGWLSGRRLAIVLLILAGGALVSLVVASIRTRNLIAGAAAALFVGILVRALNDLFGSKGKSERRDEN